MRKDPYLIFNELWKDIGMKTRNIPMITEKTNSIEQLHAIMFKVSVKINRRMFVIAKEMFEEQREKPLSAVHLNTRTENDPTIKDIFSRNNIYYSSIRRSITMKLSEAYSSYTKRNKKFPKRPIRLDPHKAFRLRDVVVDYKDGILQLVSPSEKPVNNRYKKFDIPFTISEYYIKDLKAESLNGKKDCNVRIKKNKVVFNTKVEHSIYWKYEPIDYLGIDINQADPFIATTHQIDSLTKDKVFNRSQEMARLVALLKLQNGELKNLNKSETSIKSKERNTLRLSVQDSHRKLSEQIEPVVQKIIDYAVENSLLVCIDSVATGGSSGDYGQSSAIKLLREKCEKKSVPFVVVPTPYTSLYNSKHNIILSNKHRSKDRKTFTYDKTTYDADLNAAKNIGLFGQKIWYDGYDNFKRWLKGLVDCPL